MIKSRRPPIPSAGRAAVFAMFLVLASSAIGQDSKKDVRAIIQEVDPVIGTITVILTEGTKSRVDRIRTFNLLKPDIPVTDPSDKPRKLTDLQADDRVLLRLADDDVSAIRLAPPLLHGTLVKLNALERKGVVRTKIGDKTITVPDSAKILNQGQPAKFQDLKLGAVVLVAFAQDQKTVLEVRTGKALQPFTKLIKGIGYLIAVDRERHAVRVLANYSGGDFSVLRDLPVNKDASFGLLFKAKHFRDISEEEMDAGVKIQYWTDVASGKVAHLEIEMPILGRRSIKKLDVKSRQLTLEDPEGEKVLTLAPQVKIRTPNGLGRMEDLRPQLAVVCALSPDRKTAELVQILEK